MKRSGTRTGGSAIAKKGATNERIAKIAIEIGTIGTTMRFGAATKKCAVATKRFDAATRSALDASVKRRLVGGAKTSVDAGSMKNACVAWTKKSDVETKRSGVATRCNV